MDRFRAGIIFIAIRIILLPLKMGKSSNGAGAFSCIDLLALLAKQFGNHLPSFYMFGNHLDDHNDGYAEQHAPYAP